MNLFIIEAESGISGTCLLGQGSTLEAAWIDAYGPKPWTPYQKACAKKAWYKEITEDELYELHGLP